MYLYREQINPKSLINSDISIKISCHKGFRAKYLAKGTPRPVCEVVLPLCAAAVTRSEHLVPRVRCDCNQKRP